MKKILSAILVVLCIGGIFAYRWKTQNDIKQLVISACDDFIDEYDYSNTVGFTIEKLDYELNKVRKIKENYYLVDITWYIDYSNSDYTESVRNEKLLDMVGNAIILRVNQNNGILITYSDKVHNDSICVIVNSGAAFSGTNQHAIDEMKAGNSKDYHGHDKYDAMEIARSVVKEHLKSPSSAKFCSITDATFSCDGNSWTVSGWVDAQNSFGASLRKSFTVKFTWADDAKYSVDYCQIEE